MALQAGIVGLPNVGKSTLFNALTAAGADSSNYPFCTIEPNVGVVPVPDDRLAQIASVIETKEVVPAVVEVVDIAGLVRGASEGEGLGNQFLGHIRSVDAVLHVVRCFDDPDVAHVEGGIDPQRDIETVNLELVLADLQTIEKRLDRLGRLVRTGDKTVVFDLEVTNRLAGILGDGRPARAAPWSGEELRSVRDAQLITLRPMLYVCNVDEDGLAGNDYVEQVRKHAEAEGSRVVTICAKVEEELAELEPDERLEFLADLGLAEPGLAILAREAYELLDLETFFTTSPKEIRAWTVRRGTRAPQAAGSVHGDFERGFIRAEVYRIPDLLALGGEVAVRAAGKMRVEGKDYVVHDGDVIYFRFNV